MISIRQTIAEALDNKKPIEDLGDKPLEFRALCEAFRHLDIQQECISKLPHALSSLFLKNDIIRVSTQQLPQIAADVAGCLLPCIGKTEENATKTLSLASIQIATAILSIIKSHPDDLYREIATEDICQMWGIPEPISEPSPAPSRFDGVISAFRRRVNDDPAWSHAWLRSDHSPFEEDGSLQTQEYRAWLAFESFWKAQAWREEGMLERALSCLTQQRAYGESHPCLCLLMADILTDLGQFGLAENEIARLDTDIPEIYASPDNAYRLNQNLWQNIVAQHRHRLGKTVLKKALSSRDVDDSLLQLAMNIGDDNTICEAALCWFDADITPVDVLIDCLYKNAQARNLWIKQIVKRGENSNLDKLYSVYTKLEQSMPNDAEIQLLNVMSQLDSLSSAAQTLERCLRKLPSSSDLYITALDLWVDIQCTQMQYDEALKGIIPALIDGLPHADQLLRFIMTSAPRSALQMLQAVIVEQAGLEKTRTIFDRLRKTPDPEQTAPLPIRQYTLDEISILMLPVPFQIEYHASRLHPHEDPAKSARRESVLAARGIVSKKFDAPPEPASWIHTPQPKASDGFHQ